MGCLLWENWPRYNGTALYHDYWGGPGDTRSEVISSHGSEYARYQFIFLFELHYIRTRVISHQPISIKPSFHTICYGVHSFYRKPGDACCSVCASSTHLCRNDVSLVLLAGTSPMSSTKLTSVSACDSWPSSSTSMKWVLLVNCWERYLLNFYDNFF